MKYRLLSDTGVFVSEICLGAMTFGGQSGIWQQIGGLDQKATDLCRLTAVAADGDELSRYTSRRRTAAAQRDSVRRTRFFQQNMGGTYNPDVYDLATPGTFHGDIEWYCRKAREYGGPILELGAGTGRITFPIAQEGVSVHALDANQGMLDALRRKTGALPPEVRQLITITEGDMRRFRLERTFSFVIIPFRAFLHNLTSDDQLACLQCVHEHLVPGGRLAFNVFHPSLEYMAQHSGPFAGIWRWTASYPLPEGGHVLRSEANRYDTVKRRVHSRHRYEHYDADGALTRTFLHHLELAYLYPPDIRQLLERGGFDAIEITGDYKGRPFEKDTDELVVEAKRA